MGKIGFRVIGFLVIVGSIFLFGFVTGGAFGSGMVVDQFERCLPAQTVQDLRPCAGGDQP